MSRISRVTQKIFAGSAANNGQFGSAQAGTPTTSSSLATIMSLGAWAQGWLDAVMGSSKFPPLEEFQAIDYVTTTQLAYLFQQGISEWDTGTTYYAADTGISGSVVMQPGNTNLFLSLTNANQGNALPTAPASNSNWQFLGDLANLATNGNLKEQATTGTSHTYATADSGYITKRSNSGTAMTDTLPGTSGALAAGLFGYIENIDATASVTVAVGAGGTINQGLNTGSFIIEPGELWAWQSQGTGVYNVWRAASSVLHASGVKSSFKNLKASWASNTTLNFSADELVLEDANGNTRKISTFSQTINSATSGAGGLDTGSIANTTWYYLYAIYNPATNAQSAIISASATAPTLPSGYTFASGALSAVRTDSSAHFLGFIQAGRKSRYLVNSNLSGLPGMASGVAGNVSTPTWIAVATGTFVPSNATEIDVSTWGGVSSDAIVIAPNNSYGGIGSNTNPPPIIIGNPGQILNTNATLLLESTNIYWASNAADNHLYCLGFTINI